ncbi:MAG TPA: amidohydrolase/deacetylase family metallohydrolase [Gaiellaceae bacterium]
MLYDALIKGGEVVDQSAGYHGPLDVAISRGRIAAVDEHIDADAAFRVIDARGALVLPGLVDLHTHTFHGFSFWGVDPDPIATRTGVTTWNDAGTPGALTLEAFRRHIVDEAAVTITTYLNIANIGLVGENYETANLEYCDVGLFRRAVDRHRDLVVGVKVRIGTPTVGATGVESLRRAVQAGDECGLPVMVHIAMAPPSVDEVLDLLRPGDICTHAFTGLTMKMIDGEGRLLESARRALDRGVHLDIGHGTGSFSFETAEALLAQGVQPDTISTDVHQQSIHGPMFDLPTTMTKFLALGMSLPDVVRASTSRPAEIIGLERDVGTLRPGARADIGLFSLLEGEFPLYDIAGEMRLSPVLLRNTLTILGGRELPRREPEPRAFWTEPTWPEGQIVFTAKQQLLHELGHTPDAMAAEVEQKQAAHA